MLCSLQAECFLLPVFVCFSICFLLCGILESSQWGTADGGIAKQDSALRINAVKHRPCNLLNGSESLWNCPIPFALSPVWPRIGCLWTRAKRCPLSALHFTRAPAEPLSISSLCFFAYSPFSLSPRWVQIKSEEHLNRKPQDEQKSREQPRNSKKKRKIQ